MTSGAIVPSPAQITDTVTYDAGLNVSTSDPRTAGVAVIPVTTPGTYSFSTTVTVPVLGVCVVSCVCYICARTHAGRLCGVWLCGWKANPSSCLWLCVWYQL